ncbi:Hypothetical predicted protein [Paramuricea clavata]|uniref:Uncharacterized protein n=1 Tax=Paramuricea clavata TaxID=317549 RepID=A0A6S7GWI7_PARCT|nr:Hypothetical predicted protein [Paramuricea clavata]
MAYLKVPTVVVFLLMFSNWWNVESKNVQRRTPFIPIAAASKVWSVIGEALGVASAIQGIICTSTDACGGDKVGQKLENLEKKLDAMHSDLTSIKDLADEIWDNSKKKWYFNHVDHIAFLRKEVIRDLQKENVTDLVKDRRQLFINEVLGGAGNDEYVTKALFYIPALVTKEGLVTHYFDVQIKKGKSTRDAARLTWRFVKQLFRYQEDGYASVALAASIKYKNKDKSYSQLMAKVCNWWPKPEDSEYGKLCTKIKNIDKGENAKDRRKPQQDFLFAIGDLARYPVQLMKTDCNKFIDSDTLLYEAGHLFVVQPAAKKILMVNRESFDIVKTIHVPGTECGGNCHPLGIAINVEHKVMAIAAQTKISGGESKVMLFNIKGKLEEPNGISIEHYYTMSQLLNVGSKKADVRSVAFCGNRFGYADYNGVIRHWGMRWKSSTPEPDLHDRLSWYLRRYKNIFYGKTYYLSCSNSRQDWVIEKTYFAAADDGVGAVPSINTKTRHVLKVLDIAKPNVKVSDWNDVKDGSSRLDLIKGIAMDSKKNLFYSSGGDIFKNSVSGVYQRTYDGKRRYIREWNQGHKVKMFGMAVDDSGFLFSVQEDASGERCLHKFQHEIALEDINVS